MKNLLILFLILISLLSYSQVKPKRTAKQIVDTHLQSRAWLEKRVTYYNSLYHKYQISNPKKSQIYLDSSKYYHRSWLHHAQIIVDSTKTKK